MAVRSKRLAGPATVAANGSATLYTTPAGETALIKGVTLFAQTASTVAYLGINGLTSGNLILAEPVALGDGVTLQTFWVLHPGDTLEAYAVAAGALTVSIHGAELEGVAD